MSQSLTQTSSFTKMIIFLLIFLVSYLIYSLMKTVYEDYTMDKNIADFKYENDLIREQNESKNDDYLYYTSSEYIDKIAKQSWNLVNPGERVIIISSSNISIDKNPQEIYEYAIYDDKSIRKEWWDLFFN